MPQEVENVSSKEASTIENKNALKSRVRSTRLPDSAGESADDTSSEWGPDDRSRDGPQRHHVHAERRQPDRGDRSWRRSRHPRGEATDRGRAWGPPAAIPDPGAATTYGDERRRGRRHTADDRRPAGRQHAVEFDPVRRWGPVERERNARFRLAARDYDRDFDRSGRDGGRPDRAHERVGHRHGSDGTGTETGQGRCSF